MQRLQRERRVAQPGVAVVPVTLAPRRLGQRGGERRHRRARGHVGEPLDRHGRALDRLAPAMVGQARARQPATPIARGRRERRVGLIDRLRRGELLSPRKRAVDLVALLERVPGSDPVALHTDGHIRLQANGGVVPARVSPMAFLGDRPLRGDASIVKDRFASQLHLDVALKAHRDPHEDVIGVFVGWRSGVGRDEIDAAAGAKGERVAHDHPAGGRGPGGEQRVRTRLVDARRGHVDPEGREAKGAGLAVEQRTEHARGVEARHTQPVDRPVGGDQRAGVAVGEEGVVGDRRERRRGGGALRGLRFGDLGLGGLWLGLCLGGAHAAIHGPCHAPNPLTSASPAAGPHVPGA